MEKLTKDRILEKLHDNREKIRSFGVENLTLFGSYVRGDQEEDSDIDFLVEFKEDRGNFRDHINLLHFLEDLFEKEIDLVKKDLIREELKEPILGGKLNEAKV